MLFLRRYFLAGLLFWLPIWVTLLVLHFLYQLVSGIFSLLPHAYQPQHWFSVSIPGFEIIVALLLVLVTGIGITNFLGNKMVEFGEALVARIPLVRTIYMGTKQVADTLLSRSNQSFSKVLLVEYPRKGTWTLAFLTNHQHPDFAKDLNHDHVCVFIPTTPNPTSGFLLMLPKHEVIELDISLDQALKFILSLGVIN